MCSDHFQTIILIICLFGIIELISTVFIEHYSNSCESHRHRLSFIELSGMLGILGTLGYFGLKELKTNYQYLYLILSNVYFVSMTCMSIYWLVQLTTQSRQFYDEYDRGDCSIYVFYFILISLLGHVLIVLMIIFGAVYYYYCDRLYR
jgi:hypothetical protein